MGNLNVEVLDDAGKLLFVCVNMSSRAKADKLFDDRNRKIAEGEEGRAVEVRILDDGEPVRYAHYRPELMGISGLLQYRGMTNEAINTEVGYDYTYVVETWDIVLCKRCAALVPTPEVETHTKWHKQLGK